MNKNNGSNKANIESGLKPGKYIALNKEGEKFKFAYTENNVSYYNSRKLEARIEEDKEGFVYMVYKKKKYPVEVIAKNQNKYQVLINNVEYDFSIETPISFRRKKFLQKKLKDQTFDQLVAPMPGKIIDILVEEEAEVKEGEPVLILEAMKMQNEITSQSNGKIKKINVKSGDNVNKDDI